jgi:hypothetical protein
MLKLLFIGALIFVLYRVVMGPYLAAPTMKKEDPKSKPEEDDYVDYEEVD